MAEYIEREKLLRDINHYHISDGKFQHWVEVQPAADVAPVVHGRWEIVVGSNGKEYMVCSCCRVSQNLTGVFTYCPNCGCRMDGGDNSDVD